eukprot:gnl/MRDRNA2_/MRDRNA2_166929_c0_seq1.p1 gnl/MRDRNA2_/MRDRNA2_166929_c0~~gnl/MRDRNA2_/MRDRNA2_166929_c0_seq1.p1  ORF type:complete len:564 (-),score=105.08 gnl/MRDRNA2_/MRDRNA2_166929_c0_seq1:59-1750(-)
MAQSSHPKQCQFAKLNGNFQYPMGGFCGEEVPDHRMQSGNFQGRVPDHMPVKPHQVVPPKCLHQERAAMAKMRHQTPPGNPLKAGVMHQQPICKAPKASPPAQLRDILLLKEHFDKSDKQCKKEEDEAVVQEKLYDLLRLLSNAQKNQEAAEQNMDTHFQGGYSSGRGDMTCPMTDDFHQDKVLSPPPIAKNHGLPPRAVSNMQCYESEIRPAHAKMATNQHITRQAASNQHIPMPPTFSNQLNPKQNIPQRSAQSNTFHSEVHSDARPKVLLPKSYSFGRNSAPNFCAPGSSKMNLAENEELQLHDMMQEAPVRSLPFSQVGHFQRHNARSPQPQPSQRQPAQPYPHLSQESRAQVLAPQMRNRPDVDVNAEDIFEDDELDEDTFEDEHFEENGDLEMLQRYGGIPPPPPGLGVEIPVEHIGLADQDSERTTLMISNIPARCTQARLLEKWPADGSYDFLYLPFRFGEHKNFGYAFVNFTSHEAAVEFYLVWQGKTLGMKNDGQKPLVIRWASIQGRDQNIKHSLNRKIKRIRNPPFQPAIFEGTERVDFLGYLDMISSRQM